MAAGHSLRRPVDSGRPARAAAARNAGPTSAANGGRTGRVVEEARPRQVVRHPRRAQKLARHQSVKRNGARES